MRNMRNLSSKNYGRKTLEILDAHTCISDHTQSILTLATRPNTEKKMTKFTKFAQRMSRCDSFSLNASPNT